MCIRNGFADLSTEEFAARHGFTSSEWNDASSDESEPRLSSSSSSSSSSSTSDARGPLRDQ